MVNISNDNGVDVGNLSKTKAYVILLMFIGCLLVLIFVLSKYDLIKFNKPMNANNISAADLVDLESYTPIKNADLDTDGDGTPNWYEVVSNTDPNSDSSNPNTYKEIANEQVTATSNLTTLVSRDLYTLASYDSNASGTLDTNSITSQLSASVADALKPKKIEFISVSKDLTKAQIQRFGENVAMIFTNLIGSSANVELEEMKAAQGFSKTKAKADDLRKMCNDAKKIAGIPSAYSTMFIDLVYNCDYYVNILDAFVTSDNDPVKAILAVEAHQINRESISTSLKSFASKLLNEDKVKYTSKEFGSIYYQVK